MTCKDNDNRSDLMMIHPCWWEHNLPAAQSDPIAQVIMKIRTINTGKSSKYSTEWQMFGQRGSFAGLDTCNDFEFGHFDSHSHLRFDVKRRAIYNRYDIDAHLNILVKTNYFKSLCIKYERRCIKLLLQVRPTNFL